MIRKTEGMIPAGIKAKPLLKSISAGLTVCLVISLSVFNLQFIHDLRRIYYYDMSEKRIIDEEIYHRLHNFSGYTELCFHIFIVFFVCLAGMALYFFISHFIGSKSIYTMLRVGRRELIKRCLGLPVLSAIAGGLTMGVSYLLMIIIYILFLPELHL